MMTIVHTVGEKERLNLRLHVEKVTEIKFKPKSSELNYALEGKVA